MVRLNGGQGGTTRSGSQVEVGEVRDTRTCSGNGGQDLCEGGEVRAVGGRGTARSESQLEVGEVRDTGICSGNGGVLQASLRGG